MRWRVSRPPCFRARCRASGARSPMRSAAALAEDVVAPIDVPPFDRSNVDGFAVRSADLASAGEAHAGPPDAERRSDRLRHRADAAGVVGNRHVNRDRRPGAARRRRHRDGRAHAAGGTSRDRNPPRRLARAVRVLCRFRYRARRGAAARRHHHRLARDRHAGGLRHRAGYRRAPAARRHHLHRRRTGAARPAAAPGRDLRHQRRDRHRGDHGERRRGEISRRHSR